MLTTGFGTVFDDDGPVPGVGRPVDTMGAVFGITCCLP